MQARIQKRRMHHIMRVCQPVRKPDFAKCLMITDVQFADASKARPIFEPELVQPVIEIGGGHWLMTTVAHLFRGKCRPGRGSRLAQGAGHVSMPDLRVLCVST